MKARGGPEPCVNMSDAVMMKIKIRQAPTLSAMRIKFVGSVNNKKPALVVEAPNIEYQEICSSSLADEKRLKTLWGKLILANPHPIAA